MDNWSNWVLDITFGENPPCFCPINDDDMSIVIGMNMITEKCPGNLIGVFSENEGEAERWVNENPDWKSRYQ